MSAPPVRLGRPLDGITRRSLLRASGVLGATALASGFGKVGLDTVLARAGTDPLPAGTPILVVLTLYGGNDGLNTLVPFADPAYHSARPGLALAPDTVLRLDDDFGLNPGLAHVATEFGAGRVAIVQGVGYPGADRSHFRSMDVWQTASPATPATSGWLGRWLDASGGDPLLALGIDEVLPPLLVGERSVAAALSPTTRPVRPVVGRTLAALASNAPRSGGPAETEATAAVRASYAAYGRLASLAAGVENGDPVPTDRLAAQLRVVARCIRAGAPTRVYAASLAGFDTHAGELATQRSLLTRVDGALAGFRTALAGHERARDVVVLAYSEFGRRVAANASDGTDHGTAGPVFLLGDRVRGGLHGERPSLTGLDRGDLRTTTDFRSVYAAVLARVLDTDPERVLPPGSPGPLDLLV